MVSVMIFVELLLSIVDFVEVIEVNVVLVS